MRDDEARRTVIVGFLVDALDADPAMVADPDVRLVEEELIDSLGIFSLVDFIEERFGVVIEVEEITIENFATVRAIDALIAGKAGQPS